MGTDTTLFAGTVTDCSRRTWYSLVVVTLPWFACVRIVDNLATHSYDTPRYLIDCRLPLIAAAGREHPF